MEFNYFEFQGTSGRSPGAVAAVATYINQVLSSLGLHMSTRSVSIYLLIRLEQFVSPIINAL